MEKSPIFFSLQSLSKVNVHYHFIEGRGSSFSGAQQCASGQKVDGQLLHQVSDPGRRELNVPSLPTVLLVMDFQI